MKLATDLTTMQRIDWLFAPQRTCEELTAALHDDNWQVQQAALNALDARAEADAVEAIRALLQRQDALDVYGAPDADATDATSTDPQVQTWCCRFRVKQAACLALGRIAETHGGDALGDAGVDHLCRYATDLDEDYPVRAAACHSLGAAGATRAIDTLRAAARDGEWCTATEAHKALVRLGAAEA